ncbi:MAG: DUF6102 family protein [Oscillospiraceae bacterium]|nr:DUF6102 family protein [Oscillospiraceae bacterium]
MEIILVLLIAALLSGALYFVDGALQSIVPVCLNAENYMDSLTGLSWFGEVYKITFAFGISLIVLKFLKKGFDTYVTWTEGDPDSEPLTLLGNFFKAMIVAIGFPAMYGWMVTIVTDLTDQLMAAIGAGSDMSFAGVISGIASAGLFTAIISLVFFILFALLYFQFLGRGLEMLILRLGMPITCIGLLDSDKGVFGAYIKKFFQSTLAVVVQITLAKLAVGLMLNTHVFWGIAALMLAYKTPKFLADFMIAPSGGGGITNKIYYTTRVVQMAKGVFKK